MTFQRARIFNQAILPCAADAAWAYLIDWAGTARQGSPSASQRLSRTVVLEGGERDVPRTRVLTIDTIGVIRERLCHQDDDAMHLYYCIEGIGPHGIRNYLATTDVDAIAPGVCQITITARFDIGPGDDLIAAKAMVDLAHNRSVIGGLRAHLGLQG